MAETDTSINKSLDVPTETATDPHSPAGMAVRDGKGLGALGDLSSDPRLALTIGAVLQASVFSSPWPSPQTLSEMNALEPGLHRELIEEIKKQADHRRTLEKSLVERILGVQDRAQRSSFFLALIGMLLATGLSLLGAPNLLTMTIVIAAIGGPNAATILARLIDKGR